MGQLVMRGNKVVIPEKLWNQTIQLGHEGHQGMVRTKSRLREKVWSGLQITAGQRTMSGQK